jgi:hypothetical protein
MPAGQTPVARVSGSDVVVSWPAVTLNGGVSVEGYVVKRYDALTGRVASVGPSCDGTVTGVTCTEQAVPAGTWTYTDTPVQASWTGSESSASNAVQVPAGP